LYRNITRGGGQGVKDKGWRTRGEVEETG